ncbi:MarR family winged helix-turn-helix transcriptional regulator [Arthrobacter sp. MMS18-M83]|uniref:MarR family winged helix-turn-helix transcriptional regulator n=1 Tax=Arthrobacter sp. MMS18-M83 TaxID=2996261 RepID=UPI00227D503C|nr:MarR family transcriptional regulator [Arthrobacter sp. MMS18-M83]WAH97747.1 MarR family transcriptional regulator [Arthrobacter sp. MMS18-M83]
MTPDAPTSAHPVSQTNLIRLRMALGRLGRLLRQQNNDGLPYALISLIMTIHRLEPVTAKELAESEGVTPPAVTRSLNRLFELGLISREEQATDRRAQSIRLADLGEAKRIELLQKREIWLTEHIDQLTPDEVDKLIQALPALEKLTTLQVSSPPSSDDLPKTA